MDQGAAQPAGRLSVTIDGNLVAFANGTNLTPGTWTHYDIPFSASGTTAVFSLAFDSGATPAKNIIADLAYVIAPVGTGADVPEPATVALLGMGLLGLGALRRRT